MRKTKIVCTLGPATDREGVLREMLLAGMNVARFNFSHGTYEEHKARMDELVRLRDRYDLPVATMLDTKGPEIRTCNFKEGSVMLVEGQEFCLTTEDVEGDNEQVSVTYKGLPRDVKVGSEVLIDDGLIAMEVIHKTDTNVYCRVKNGGKVSNHKGINLPGTEVSMEFLSERDKEDLLFGISQDFDFVAASFTRNADDVNQLRQFLKDNGGENIRIISKIENAQGVANIDSIIEASDGIMVARGDMGVEIPNEEVPIIQKMIIKKVYKAGKIVITATQMLDSMMHNPRPTRAETTDVANAIYDGTSAVMLSGETAAGKYPVESLKTMIRIAERIEGDIDYEKRFQKIQTEGQTSVTDAISHATCTMAHDLGAKAILTVSKSGFTARMISRYRPAIMIVGTSPSRKACRQMNLSWGVMPIYLSEKANTFELLDGAADLAMARGLVDLGDLVVITAGIPIGATGSTNMVKVHTIGEKMTL
ncbi:MAG: pyruvate kinase [Lachnospiraceae bacterium]|nr:pyruvate kinase [Lachnospiraceae bacterium]